MRNNKGRNKVLYTINSLTVYPVLFVVLIVIIKKKK